MGDLPCNRLRRSLSDSSKSWKGYVSPLIPLKQKNGSISEAIVERGCQDVAHLLLDDRAAPDIPHVACSAARDPSEPVPAKLMCPGGGRIDGIDATTRCEGCESGTRTLHITYAEIGLVVVTIAVVHGAIQINSVVGILPGHHVAEQMQ